MEHERWRGHYIQIFILGYMFTKTPCDYVSGQLLEKITEKGEKNWDFTNLILHPDRTRPEYYIISLHSKMLYASQIY